MSEVYLIALTADARQATDPVDLAVALPDRLGSHQVEVIERGYKGRSVTVSMPRDLIKRVQLEMPFVTIEPVSDMSLL